MLCFKFMDFFTDKFETSQDVKHSCAVAFCNLSNQLSWYDWFTEGSIGRKCTSCFVSFKNVFSNDSSDLVTRKVEVRTIWLADFNTKAVSIWVSCQQQIRLYLVAVLQTELQCFPNFWVRIRTGGKVAVWIFLFLNNGHFLNADAVQNGANRLVSRAVQRSVDNLQTAFCT